jgi:hypothetical protein
MSRMNLPRQAGLATATLGLVVAIFLPASGQDDPMPLACHIEHQAAADRVTIEGRISGRPAEAGSFRLEIVKIDRAGSSDIRQGGAFALGADGTATAGHATVSLLKGGRLSVRLVARAGGEEAECRLEAGDRAELGPGRGGVAADRRPPR